MISRLIPAFALVALVGASGCTIRTGEAADPHHHNHKSPPPPPPPAKKKAEPKREVPAKEVEVVRETPKPDPVDSGYRADERWEKLGEATANGKNDHDVISVGRSEGKFSAIRFKVKNSNVKMQNVVVHFTDGTKFSPSTRVEFKEGSVSNPIDLPGGKRSIKSVNFRYSDGAGTGNGVVEVFGL